MAHFRRGHSTQTLAHRIVAAMLLLLLGTSIASCAAIDGVTGEETRGQHLTLAGSVFGPGTLDPALVRDVESAFLSRQIFRGLVSLDESLQPQPELAQEIDISADGLSYSFTLHQTATFHDGAPIDADAVVGSFHRASDPALAGGDGSALPAATYFADIEGIEERLSGQSSVISGVVAVDRWTVEIILRRPAVNFLAKLTGSPAAIVDVQTATAENWWHTPNGSGPSMVDAYRPQERLELVSFNGFIGGRPRLDGVTVLFGDDALQPLNLYEAERIDVTAVPGWAVDRLTTPTDPLYPHLVEMPELSITFIALNPNVEPFDDPDVRRMVVHGIDREKLVRVALDGRVELAQGMIAPRIAETDWPAEMPPHKLTRARRLGESIGAIEPPVTLFEPGGGISGTVQAVLERDLGIAVDVVDQPWPEFTQRLEQGDLPAFVLTWVADFPDPENVLATLLRTGSPDNYLGYSNAAFDRHVDEANAEPDPDRRRMLYLEAQQIAVDDAVVIPLYHEVSYTLIQPWVRGLEVTEIGILSLDDVWIED